MAVIFGWMMTVGLATATVLIHSAALDVIGKRSLRQPSPRAGNIVFAVLGLLLAHTCEIWLYAGGLYLLDYGLNQGGLAATVSEVQFADYLYFSATSYSSLGSSQVIPTGAARIVASF